MSDISLRSSVSRKLEVFNGKEGWVKVLYVLGMLSLLVLGGYYLLPFVIIAFENMLIAGALGVGLLIFLYLAFSQNVQTAFIYFLDGLALKARNLVVTSDPFTTAQVALKKLDKKKQQVGDATDALLGDQRNLETKIQKFSKERTAALNKAVAAERANNVLMQESFANQAQSLKEAIDQLTPMLERTTSLRLSFKQTYDRLEAKGQERQKQLEIALEVHGIMETSSTAVKAAKALMSGPDQEMFELSMKNISDTTFQLIGEVDNFMDVTEPLRAQQDFEKQAKTEEALTEYRKWAESDSELMSKKEKQRLLEGGNPAQFLSPAPATTGDKYNLLGRRGK